MKSKNTKKNTNTSVKTPKKKNNDRFTDPNVFVVKKKTKK